MSGDLSGAELSTIVLNFTPISRTVAEISVTDRRTNGQTGRRTNITPPVSLDWRMDKQQCLFADDTVFVCFMMLSASLRTFMFTCLANAVK